MKSKLYFAAFIGIVSNILIFILVNLYWDILDHPYMIFLLVVLGLLMLWSLIYTFNILKWYFISSFKRCKHDYRLIHHFTLESEYDIVVGSGKVPNTHLSMKRIVVTDYKCNKCNKLKRLKVKTNS